MKNMNQLTPAEKAKELVDKYQSGYTIGRFSYQLPNDLQDSKQCALIAVEEIQKLPNINYSNNKDSSQYDYWQEVKEELQKL
jgi:hypothetical protein